MQFTLDCFTVTLFMIAEKLKQPQSPSIDVWRAVRRIHVWNTNKNESRLPRCSGGVYTSAVTNSSNLTQQEGMPGARNLPNYPRLVKSWIFEESLHLPLY